MKIQGGITSIGINPLFVKRPNEHHPGVLLGKYTSEKNPKYPINAENEPCDNIICLHVLPN